MTPERTPTGDAAGEELLGRYVVRERIGEGTWADVHRATAGSPRREVALKILKGGVRSQARERFGLEIEVLARLAHPGITAVHEAGTTPDGRAYYAMELVRGRPVLEWVRTERPTPRECIELFASICDGVDHAHRLGIVHRDLKSSNVLVTDDHQPKLLDFGSARVLDETTGDHRLTEATDLVGSLQCVAPEQVAGHAVDARADVWALGALLYEALSGLPPHDLKGRPVQEILRLKTTDAPRLSKRCPHLRGDIEHVVARALAVDPRERYATAGDLGADLRNSLSDREVHARKDDLFRATRRLVRRHRGATVGIGLVVAALIVGTAATNMARDHAEHMAEVTRRQADEVRRLSDRHRLAELIGGADALWPCAPAQLEPMDDWLDRARQLTRRLPLHRNTLAQWEADASDPRDAASAGMVTKSRSPDERAETEGLWRLEKLRDLVEVLEAFEGDPSFRNGIGDMRGRVGRTAALGQASLVEGGGAWRTARESIADAAACPEYGGMDLPVQFGLLPIGRDPESGLWEFAHLESGIPPERDPDGRLVFDERSAVILVLIPGGDSLLGGQRDDPDGPLYDADAPKRSLPVHEVSLVPFFLSKFEVTQAQWIRLTGENPSYYWAGWEVQGEVTTFLNPVDNITWNDATETMRRAGLALPTMDQWEFAARAGAQTRFLAGDDATGLDGYANLHDVRAVEVGDYGWQFDTTDMLDDGFAVPCPVGLFLPNAYGLHDVLGNLNEFVRGADHPGEGGTIPIGPGGYRGGSFYERLDEHRLSRLVRSPPDRPAATHGLRPMRPIDVPTASPDGSSR